jgi:superoxide dismutase
MAQRRTGSNLGRLQDEKAFKHMDERAQKHVRNVVEKRVKLMGHIDEERKKAFVQHMMQREMEFREELENIVDIEEKKQRVKLHEEEWEMLKNAKGNMPVSVELFGDVERCCHTLSLCHCPIYLICTCVGSQATAGRYLAC